MRRDLLPCVLFALGITACEPIEQFQQLPFVQHSAPGEPRWRVDLNRVRDGVFLPYRPRCLDQVRVGHVVEFRNFLPETSANVTKMSGPAALYSPNLTKPYQYVGPQDPANTLCDVEVDGVCAERPEWSYWRFEFTVPGTYDWLDTNQSTTGRKVVDPYYGTETFVGIDPSSPFGTICVLGEDGSGCAGVCCSSDSECTGNTRCFKSDVEALGRCLTPSG